MSSASWHARVECGRETGAGFLVSERHVLTCAHVVRDSVGAQVAVAFPHRGDLGAVAAEVTARGGWEGHTDPGDLAVLELDRPVPIAPAGFAAPDDAYAEPRPRLVAYGFPRGYEEGTIAEYRATAAQLIADEWIQLEAWSAHGQPLAPGFSGAAVALADSGLVVGMVSAAAGAAGVRTGRMLPAQVMARYWPRIAELIPARARHGTDPARLRDLVDRAEKAGAALACAPERLYLDAVGPLGPPAPPGGFATLWSAAWYVLSEVEVPGAARRLTERLQELVETPEPVRAAATPADAARVPGPAPVGSAASAPARPRPAWSPILVELARSGAGDDQVLVEVSACRDGRRHPVGSRTLARGRVRAYVQELIEEAFGRLPLDAAELIAFVLPREWLNEPVAHWARSADDPTPLGCSYPLVVTDRARRAGGLRHQLARKWERLDGKATTAVHRVECAAGEAPNKLRFRLRHDEADLAGFAAPPRSPRLGPHFEVSLNAPAPVLLWPRAGCEHDGGDCTGAAFLDQLAAHLSRLPPAELPRHVLEFREAADAADEPDRHWARDIQLLWDDPRCFPDAAPAPLRSPVA
ncbi:trypsin-like peptidase domain-containing protein [Streptomyces sp. NRRL B-1347]|uniref:VMAP-C domain-containing protein n=1 Tax=Streptomyces sp. NRRL B-1347 TaxID=1476877 RepID=UPI0004C534ED|nr:trypsin-like peptidase domain-containing protein [Streptomyces sp. NRRL B-1347]